MKEKKVPLLVYKSYEKNYQSVLDFHWLPFIVAKEYINDGMTKKQLVNFKEIINLHWDQVAELLMCTERMLHLKKPDNVFNKSVSDRFVGLIRFYSHLYNLYGDRQKVNELMVSPIRDEELEIIPMGLVPHITGRSYLLEYVFHFSKLKNPGKI